MYGIERREKIEPGMTGAGGESCCLCQAAGLLKSNKNPQPTFLETTILLMFRLEELFKCEW